MYMRINLHICTYIYIACIYIQAHTHTHIYIYTYMCTYMYICIYACMRMCIYICKQNHHYLGLRLLFRVPALGPDLDSEGAEHNGLL